MKKCYTCKKDKELKDFYSIRKLSENLKRDCKVCEAKRVRELRKSKKEGTIYAY